MNRIPCPDCSRTFRKLAHLQDHRSTKHGVALPARSNKARAHELEALSVKLLRSLETADRFIRQEMAGLHNPARTAVIDSARTILRGNHDAA